MHLQILWSNVSVTGSMLNRQVQASVKAKGKLRDVPTTHRRTLRHNTMTNCAGTFVPVRHEGVWRSGGIAPSFLTSELDGGVLSASPPNRLTSGEPSSGTHSVGGWVALPGPEPRSSSRQRSRYTD
jgi:hypothetical protein